MPRSHSWRGKKFPLGSEKRRRRFFPLFAFEAPPFSPHERKENYYFQEEPLLRPKWGRGLFLDF